MALVCADSALKSDHTGQVTRDLAWRYCICAADAMRKNKGSAAFKIKKHGPTKKQMERCATYASALM